MALPPSTVETPTKARLALVGWLCALALILYLDRMCFGQVVKPIQDELGLSNKQISYAAMGFTLAYGLFAVPVGRLGDRFGSRVVLARIVFAWSVFIALMGSASGLIMLVSMRFLFGASEAGTFPNTARVISRWFPAGERGRVQGMLLASANAGAIIAPAAAAIVIDGLGWRWVFAVFALPGLAWSAAFWLWFRDNPADHPRVNAAELEIIRASSTTVSHPGAVPWQAILNHRGIIFLALINILGSFYTYFFYDWFPNYLSNGRGLVNFSTGLIASCVQCGAAAGVLFGGWIADRIPRWSSDAIRTRRRVGVICYLSSAGLLFAAARCDNAAMFTALCTASFCMMQATLPNWWSMIIPQAGRHVGVIFGLANGLGAVGAMASQGFVGAFADYQKARGLSGREQWDPVFDVYVCVLLLAAAVWQLYRYRPLEDPAPEQPSEKKA